MKRRFLFNGKVSLFAAIGLIAFVNLGFWQLSREEEKQALLSERQQRAALPPLTAMELPVKGDLAGRPVLLDGRFTPHIVLLDNRVLAGRVGFEAHQLFRDASGLLLVVNRGFVPMGESREVLPGIPDPGGQKQRIRGVVYQPAGEALLLKAATAPIDDFPAIVQRIDIERLAASVKGELYPWVIRLDEHQPGALPRHWPDSVMSPAQHRGYAVQWFAMAVAVTLAWLFFSFRRQGVS